VGEKKKEAREGERLIEWLTEDVEEKGQGQHKASKTEEEGP
jgi:hypothetical protein